MRTEKKSRKLSVLAAVLILVAGIFIGGYLVLKSDRGAASQLDQILKRNSFNAQTCQPNAGDQNYDADDDGLKDWQEIQIYKTDACDPDTDGDGYLDGEEVASNYDPNKKAPGDELPNTSHSGNRPLPQNLTEALRQNLVQQITDAKIQPFDSSGQLLSADALQNYPGIEVALGKSMAESANIFAPEQFDGNQLKTTPDNSRAAIQQYSTEVANAIPSFQFQPSLMDNLFASGDQTFSASEAAMFLKVIQDNDTSDLERNLRVYQTAYENMRSITVPSGLKDLHLEAINMLASTIKIYQAIEEANSDPVKANLALSAYGQIMDQVMNWAQKMVSFVKAQP